MQVYMYEYIQIYINVYILSYVYMYTGIHIYIHIYTGSLMRGSFGALMRQYEHMYISMCTCIVTRTYVCLQNKQDIHISFHIVYI